MRRTDGRAMDELRSLVLDTGFHRKADGAVLVTWGGTRVLCTASLQEGVPPFLKGQGRGWLTAEYAMLPASTSPRKSRESGKPDGRSVEIQRLVGRALRTSVDFAALGERTVYLDCDVVEADGGTRTASITAAWVALKIAAQRWVRSGALTADPVSGGVAAVSVGMLAGEPLLDLCYEEDSRADVDMNLVMTHEGAWVEVQGTGEHRAFTPCELSAMLAVGQKGLGEIVALQKKAVDACGVRP